MYSCLRRSNGLTRGSSRDLAHAARVSTRRKRPRKRIAATTSATHEPRDAVEPEVVAGAHHGERHPRPATRARASAREARPADGGHHDPDDERVHRVQAGHHCVLIGGKRDQPAVVADRPGLDERVTESPLREHARGCRGHQDIAEEAHEIRSDEPVAEVGEPLVVPEVNPEQRDPDDGELREPVRIGGWRRREASTARRSSGYPGSTSTWSLFSASITSVPFQNASATPRSAAPRAAW